MTVQTNTTVATGIGNGVTSVFPIPYKFNRAEDLIVHLVDLETETETPLTLYSDYTVEGEGNENGGTLTLLAGPLPVGQRVEALRIVDLRQQTDLRNQGRFFAEVHEDVFDKLVMIDQQQQTQLDRAMLVDLLLRWNALFRRIINVGDPVADRDAAHKRYVDQGDIASRQYADSRDAHWVARTLRSADPLAPLPGPESRAGRLLSFDSSGRPIVVAPEPQSATELAMQLADPAKGAAMVARGVVAVDSIADLLALSEGQRKEGLRYLVKGYYAGSDVGGGEFYWNASADKSTADGGKVVDPDALAGFDGTPPSRDGFLAAQGGGLGVGCFVLISEPNQMNYGCVGDGSFDDSDAVQKAIDARVTFIEREHAITKSLYVYDSIDMSEATFFCDNKPITYLTLGEESSTFRYKTVGMPKLRNVYNTSGYAIDEVNPDSVGARLISIYESVINFPPKRAAEAFGTGVELFSSGPGVSYSELNNLSTMDCLKHLSFRAVGEGWITECLFLKLKTSNYSNFSPVDMDLTGLGYNYIHVDNTGPLNNEVENITFVSPTLEGVRVSDHIDVVNGTASGWVMISPRFEVPGGTFKTRGALRGATVINPSHWDKVEGFIGSDKYSGFGRSMVGVGNMPIILGSSSGNISRMGIGLLNDHRDFSTSLPDPQMVSTSHNDSLVWHINKTGLHAHGYTPDFREFNRLRIDFNQQYIRWGRTSSGQQLDYCQIGATQTGSNIVVTARTFSPFEDDSVFLGSSPLRWKEIFAANGVISTSDGRSKQDILPLSEAERRVAVKLKALIRTFRFKDAVAEKGSEARIHVGVIAQDVADAFIEEGLDPNRYGLFCYDEWDEVEEVVDEEGEVVTPHSESGNRFGIRYDELLAFIISAI